MTSTTPPPGPAGSKPPAAVKKPAESPDPLDLLDRTAVEQLLAIREQQKVLEGRVAALAEHSKKVAEEVVAKVRNDYQSQLAALGAQAAPLESSVRGENRKLVELRSEIEAQRKRVLLQRQEIELRHSVGEFDDAQFEKQTKALEKEVGAIELRLGKADKLAALFLSSFGSEEELAKEPVPPKRAAKKPLPREVPIDETMKVERPSFADDVDATRVVSISDLAEPDEDQLDGTVIFPAAHLVRRDKSGSRYRLDLGGTIVGTGSDVGVELSSSRVSARHAEVKLGAKGFEVVDLGSEHGTFVNGKRVESLALKPSDLVRFGDVEFVFESNGAGRV